MEYYASLLLNLVNNNFLIFLSETFPILKPFLPQTAENLQPHSSNSIRNATHSYVSCENATLSSGTSPLDSYKWVPPPPSPDIANARGTHTTVHVNVQG